MRCSKTLSACPLASIHHFDILSHCSDVDPDSGDQNLYYACCLTMWNTITIPSKDKCTSGQIADSNKIRVFLPRYYCIISTVPALDSMQSYVKSVATFTDNLEDWSKESEVDGVFQFHVKVDNLIQRYTASSSNLTNVPDQLPVDVNISLLFQRLDTQVRRV